MNRQISPQPASADPMIWQDPPPSRRLLKLSLALALCFFSASSLAGGLSPDTTGAILVNLVLSLSLTGSNAVMASAQLMMLLIGSTMLYLTFATFASYSRSLPVGALGAVGVGIGTSLVSGTSAGVTTALLLLIPLLLVSFFRHKLDYKGLLSLVAAFNLVALLASLVQSVVTSQGSFTVPALREFLLSSGESYIAYYKQVTQLMASSGVESVPAGLPSYTREAAVSLVLNYLPALLTAIAMVGAFCFVTWFLRADGNQPPRIGYVTEGFSLSRIGAVCFVLCSGVASFGKGVPALAASQLLIVLSLPFAIAGVNGVRRLLTRFGRGFAFLLVLPLFFFLPPTSLLLFFSICGVFETLFPRTR
ncbi:MAG: hypothetical protein IJL15_06625 [Clostridia bacterium]|nr:hypothetical protein [Clostridia bacterium]